MTPNRNANLLFLKPIDRNAATNMNVVTNQRRYAFELRVLPKALEDAITPYIVRFTYPAMAVAVVACRRRPSRRRKSATAPMSSPAPRRTRPVRIFDDGRMTYFAWAPQASVPAIFAVGADGKESLVNYGVRGQLHRGRTGGRPVRPAQRQAGRHR